MACASLARWVPGPRPGFRRKRAGGDGIQRARNKEATTMRRNAILAWTAAGMLISAAGARPVDGEEDADSRRGAPGDRRDRRRSEEAQHDRRDRGRGRRREPHGRRADRRDLRRGRADLDRQGADRGALQEADELLRRPDQQGPHRHDDGGRLHAAPGRGADHGRRRRSSARSASRGAASAAAGRGARDRSGPRRSGRRRRRSPISTPATVRAAFAKGAVLFDQGERYMVHATRRDGAGHGGGPRARTPTSSTFSTARPRS